MSPEKKKRVLDNFKQASYRNGKMLALGLNYPKFLSSTIALHGWQVDYKNFFLNHFIWRE